MIRREPLKQHLPRRHAHLLEHALLQPAQAGGDVVPAKVVGDRVVGRHKRGIALRADELELVHVDGAHVAAGLHGGDGAVVGVEDDFASVSSESL